MKSLAKLFLFSFLLIGLSISPLWAKSSPHRHLSSDADISAIREGNVQVGGSTGLSQTWYNGSQYFNFYLTAPLEYFVIDGFSLGGRLTYDHQSSNRTSYNDIYLGPSLTYYFWAKDHVGAYVDQDVLLSVYSNTDDELIVSPGVGFNYFLNPNMAFGPHLYFSHYFGLGNRADHNALGIAASFSMYLR